MSLPERHAAAIADYRAELVRLFGDRLRGITLFGSWARGEASEESDVDLLVLVEDLSNAEAHTVGQLAGDAMTNYDVLLSPLALSTGRFAELGARERLIAREIARDGVPL